MPRICTQWENKLAMTRIDHLTLEDREALRLHVQTCQACFTLYTEYLKIDNYLQRTFAGKQYATSGAGPVLSQRAARPAFPQLWPPGFRNRGLRLAGAGVCIAVLVIAILLNSLLPPIFQGNGSNSAQAASLSLNQTLPSLLQPGATWVRAVAWSPDGKYIAVLWDNNTLEVLDANKDQEIFSQDVASGYGLAWSPDSKLLASVGKEDNSMVQIWNVSTHLCEKNASQQCLIYQGHKGRIEAIAWSPDEQYIASASDDGTVQVWNAYTLHRSHTQSFVSAVTAVAWSHVGERIIAGDNNGDVQAWDAPTGLHPVSYVGHTGSITSLSWSADDRSIASSSYDGHVLTWNAATRFPERFLSPCSPVFAAIWTPGSSIYLAIACNDGSVQILNVMSQEKIASYPRNATRQYQNGVFTISWSPQGNQLITGGRGDVLTFKLGG